MLVSLGNLSINLFNNISTLLSMSNLLSLFKLFKLLSSTQTILVNFSTRGKRYKCRLQLDWLCSKNAKVVNLDQGKYFEMSSNFTFNVITLRIGPFRNFFKKISFFKNFKNFLSVRPGWPHKGKKISIFQFCDFFANWST